MYDVCILTLLTCITTHMHLSKYTLTNQFINTYYAICMLYYAILYRWSQCSAEPAVPCRIPKNGRGGGTDDVLAVLVRVVYVYNSVYLCIYA